MRNSIFGLLMMSVGIVTIFFSSVVALHAVDPLCAIPPVVGYGTRPNVMIVMDFSGSMRKSAYYSGDDEAYASYTPMTTYYGNFSSDGYYIYDDSSTTNQHLASHQQNHQR